MTVWYKLKLLNRHFGFGGVQRTCSKQRVQRREGEYRLLANYSHFINYIHSTSSRGTVCHDVSGRIYMAAVQDDYLAEQLHLRFARHLEETGLRVPLSFSITDGCRP